MTETDGKKPLTAREILFAKLRYEDKLTNEEIAKKCGIGDKTGDRWFKRPEIQAEMERLAEADTRQAQLILQRASVKAAKKLESLVEDEKYSVLFQETCRKAACNILESNKLKEVEGSVRVNITEETVAG